MATIYIDAATRQHPHVSVGAVVIKNDDEVYEFTTLFEGIDNNEAEWATLVYAIERCIEYNITEAIIYTDSQIVVDSIEKRFVKNKRFKKYLDEYMKHEASFNLLFTSFVMRKNNKHADTLAKNGLYKHLNK